MKRHILNTGMVPALSIVSGRHGPAPNLDGRWESELGSAWEFSGNSFCAIYITAKRPLKGTFSISRGRVIELTFPSGEVEVFTFSRTQNSLTIAGRKYNRV